MKRGLVTFVPGRLSQARAARGFLKGELADKLGVSSEALRSYENGSVRPLPAKVDIMAEVLSFPPSFFSLPEAKQGDLQVFWRNRKKDTKTSREQTTVRIRWACETFSVLKDYVEFPALRLPDLDLPKNWRNVSDEDIEQAAEACRAEWGLDEYPIPDITLALENIGIPVLAMDIDNSKQFGFCHQDELSGRPFVGHNVRHSSAARSRFNIAHELGHVLLHAHVQPEDQEDPQAFNAIEAQAHRFAGALLLPRTAFFREVRYPSIDTFRALKRSWNMTISAQVYRAYNLGMLTPDQMRAQFAMASRKGYNKAMGEPYDDVTPQEVPRMLRRAVDAIEEGSPVHLQVLESRLALPEEEVRAIIGRGLEPSNSNVVQLRRIV